MTNHVAARILCSLAALVVAVFGLGAVAFAQSADDLTPEKLDVIRMRCSSSQFALRQIEKRDAVSRINRGRAYDQTLRQLSAFNSRFVYNKISAPDLAQITSDIQTNVDKFRSSYDHYDSDITEALKTNCKDKPSDYYQLVVKARADRAIVGQQVTAINDLLGQYRAALLKYKDTVQ